MVFVFLSFKPKEDFKDGKINTLNLIKFYSLKPTPLKTLKDFIRMVYSLKPEMAFRRTRKRRNLFEATRNF